MIAAAAAFVALGKPAYISRGAIYVQNEPLLASLTAIQTGGFSWVTPAQTTVDEFRELLETDSFVRAVLGQTALEELFGEETADTQKIFQKARKRLWVDAPGKNLVLINAMDENPEVARQLSAAMIESYIQWKINTDREESVSAQFFFADVIRIYREDLDAAHQELEAYLHAHPDPLRGERPELEKVQIERLQASVKLAADRLASALDKEEDARLSLAQAESKARQTYLLVDNPAAPTKPEVSKKDILKDVALFVVAGMVLSGVGIVGGMLLDRSVRFAIDVQHSFSLPTLATIPEAAQRPRAKRRIKLGPRRRKGRTA